LFHRIDVNHTPLDRLGEKKSVPRTRSPAFCTGNPGLQADKLRGSGCKYRESADKLKKSKILITCQKNTFGELSSKTAVCCASKGTLSTLRDFLSSLVVINLSVCLVYNSRQRKEVEKGACFNAEINFQSRQQNQNWHHRISGNQNRKSTQVLFMYDCVKPYCYHIFCLT